MNEVDKILSEREHVYGSFDDVSRMYTNLVTLVDEADSILGCKVKCSIDMILMKIARIVSGDQYYRDNWSDIAGYAMLVVKSIDEEDKKAFEEYQNKVTTICEEYEEDEN